METLGAYIPVDRLLALADGVPLPDRSTGAALFADISGFTQLTELLVRDLGATRGAEELTHHLDEVYDTLVTELYRYGGSVISFSGDAITCWFAEDPRSGSGAALRATTCALAMQAQMARFASVVTPTGREVSLAMKASVATGDARRFAVGDPEIQMIDVLAGALLDRLAAGEHLASRGDVLLDQETLAGLGGAARVAEERVDPDSGLAFAVVAGLGRVAEPAPWPDADADSLRDEELRSWMLTHIYERLKSGQGEFLADLRPAAVLFLRFTGIDYDDDDAGERLNAFIQMAQRTIDRFGGTLLQVTIGDKGSYLYAAFGAPQAHEDDPTRAISAALELRQPPFDFIDSVQIGVSQGRMRTGAYGGVLRRTYGAIGDSVNLAARLMQAAQPSQILATRWVRDAADGFVWEGLGEIYVKGKSEPIEIYAPLSVRERRPLRLQDARYALPMVGRRAELALVESRIDRVLEGSGQIVTITGEAGMGKSRLVAEIIRLAQGRGLAGFGGGCESYGTTTSYLVWHTIWQSFFDIDPSHSAEVVEAMLSNQLSAIDPDLELRAPLLAAALNVTLPENDLTGGLDAKLRKTSLESLLVDCVRAHAGETPLMFVLEDCHWLDPLSHDLLETIARAIASLPVLIVIAMRPPEAQRLQAPRLANFPYYSEIALHDFTPDEAGELIRLKLAQVYGTEMVIPAAFAERVMARSQGNPFYVEELLNYLKDRGIDPRDSTELGEVDLPTSLHSLILSRIDQLAESQKITLKIASIIGRLFRAAILWDVYPTVDNTPDRIKMDLDVLSRLELTLVDEEPELTYLFKHIVTQQVAYETVPFAMRTSLHDRIGQAIEQRAGDSVEQLVDLLAFHYGRSANVEKQREYFMRAAEAARADFANEAAIEYFDRAIPLLAPAAQVDATRRLGQVLELVGRWDQAAARYQQALELAEQLGDRRAQGWCQTATGELMRKRGRYAEAESWHERALSSFESVGELAGVGQVLHYRGSLEAQQGHFDAARALYETSLAVRRELDDRPNIGSLLSNMGIVARAQGDLARARQLHEEGLAMRRDVGNRWAVANSLNNLGNVLLDQGDYAAARERLEEAVGLLRQIGDRWAIANSLNNLGNVARTMRDAPAAREMYQESLQIAHELGDRWALAYLLEDIGGLAGIEGRPAQALRFVGAAAALREAIGAPLSASEQGKLASLLEPVRAALSEEDQRAAEAAGRALTLEQAVGEALATP